MLCCSSLLHASIWSSWSRVGASLEFPQFYWVTSWISNASWLPWMGLYQSGTELLHMTSPNYSIHFAASNVLYKWIAPLTGNSVDCMLQHFYGSSFSWVYHKLFIHMALHMCAWHSVIQPLYCISNYLIVSNGHLVLHRIPCDQVIRIWWFPTKVQ